ncbi:MAG TPA: tyrosine-type recombinase/integrase [Paracoccus sp. (in: a-proteobacteria)]|uniref:tyrosine-type recombinase/integrase n=1 Tax=Paracoccus sp. TaxID=267 RepID=UPI002B73ABDB|nr:tyrosine-type recombinase/integrase [Paracoccus sp. (in: a-proteobacteria)]HWL56951.1 tyrosine-type recombinase/integrase [Paracoccus sp. (in: a-proteobacteria)]
MTTNIIALNTRAPKAPPKAEEPPRAFNFTQTALKKAIAAHEAAGTMQVFLRDTGCTGLVCRKQQKQWVFGVERRIRGTLRRESLGIYDSADCNVAKLREDAQAIMVAMMKGEHVPKAERDATRTKDDKFKRMTWAEVVDLHAQRNPLTRATTIQSYRYAVQRLPDEFPKRVGATSDVHVRNAYTGLLASHSAATANLTIRSLAALWSSWAEAQPKEKRPTDNPVKEFKGDGRRARKRMAPTPVRTNALLPDERAAWINEALTRMRRRGPSGGTYGALAMLALTGMRAREVLDLSWAEVEREEIVIPAGRMKADVPLVRPITPRLREILRHQKLWQEDSAWVFPSRVAAGDGSFQPVGDVRKTVDEISKAVLAEGRRLTPHDLRRGYVIAAEMAGVPGIAARLLTAHSVGDVHSDYARGIVSELPRYAVMIEDELLGEVTA